MISRKQGQHIVKILYLHDKKGRVDKIAESSTMEDLRLRAVGRSLTIAAGSLLGLLMIEEKRNFPIFKYIYEPA